MDASNDYDDCFTCNTLHVSQKNAFRNFKNFKSKGEIMNTYKIL